MLATRHNFMDKPDEYLLTPDELGMIEPIIETVDTLQKEAQVILRAITRLRGLQGDWHLVNKKLVKVDPPLLREVEAIGKG